MGFVEFGAGKAGLSLALSFAFPAAPIVVVDRGAFRDCADKTISKLQRKEQGSQVPPAVDPSVAPQSSSPVVVRVHMDVADFDFDKFIAFHESNRASSSESASLAAVETWVCVGKHLCGGCTDLALRCVERSTKRRFAAIIVATCCHHVCSLDTYVGSQFGVDDATLPAAKKVASWATAGGATAAAKTDAGVAAKRVVDYGRRGFVASSLGMQAQLVQYVGSDISPECIALVGWRC